MKKTQIRCPLAPMIFIILASIAGIGIGSMPYLQPDLINNQDIFQFALLAIGFLCIVAVFIAILNPVKIIKETPADSEGEPPAVIAAAPPPPTQVHENQNNNQAVLLLSLLQEKGKFIDFVMGDVALYSDEQIGAAARVVHQGCHNVIEDCFKPEKICMSEENSSVTLEEGFNPREYKMIGTLAGDPPYQGTLLHKGWKAKQVKLPQLNLAKSDTVEPVIHPAEIEL